MAKLDKTSKVFEVIRCRHCHGMNLDGNDNDRVWCYTCGKMRSIETVLVAQMADIEEFMKKLDHELQNIADGCDNPADDPSGESIIKHLKKFIKKNYLAP